MQVPLVFKTGLLSGHCLQASHRLSEDLYWWKLVLGAEKKVPHCVSGQFLLTLHVGPGSLYSMYQQSL